MEAQLNQVRSAIRSLNGGTITTTNQAKSKSGRKPAIPTEQLIPFVKRQIEQHGPLPQAKLQSLVAEQVERSGFAKNGLAAKLAKIVHEMDFRVSSDGMVSLANSS